MRPHKFRGKRLDRGGWVYGDLVHRAHGLTFIRKHFDGAWDEHEVDFKTVGEYIGLKDSQKREIYEGDVIQFETKLAGKFKGVCSFDQNDATFRLNSFIYTQNELTEMRANVIGDIYEDPNKVKMGTPIFEDES